MTALEHMAAARPPGIADARVPCPLCGGLIHPVAGRCKHCKEDLTSYRAGRPQAAAALPALNGAMGAAKNGHNGQNGHAVAAATVVPTPEPIAVQREGSQPILPPRPTGRSMKAARPSASWWKNWPMLVIGVAGVAMVIAIVIMLMPPSTKNAAKRISNPPPPAPERMDTSPLPDKQSQIDPWDQPGGSPQQPSAPQPKAPCDPFTDMHGCSPSAPPPPAPQVQPDPDDLFGSLGGTGGSDVMLHAIEHVCHRAKSCPDVDQAMLGMLCNQVSAMPKAPVDNSCPAAKKCLDAIDHMSCQQAGAGNAITIVTIFQDCTTAMQC